MMKFVASRGKALDDCSENKKSIKGKKCVIKIKLKFENYKNCLQAAKLENEINYPEINEINID